MKSVDPSSLLPPVLPLSVLEPPWLVPSDGVWVPEPLLVPVPEPVSVFVPPLEPFEPLEPLRQWYGKPIVISSGYRCPALNRAVGGANTSQHMKGEAADLHLPSIAIGRQWVEWLLDNVRFDHLIWEHDSYGRYWIHISYKRDDQKNRQLYTPNLLKK